MDAVRHVASVWWDAPSSSETRCYCPAEDSLFTHVFLAIQIKMAQRILLCKVNAFSPTVFSIEAPGLVWLTETLPISVQKGTQPEGGGIKPLPELPSYQAFSRFWFLTATLQ